MAGDSGLAVQPTPETNLGEFLWEENATVDWMLCLGWMGDPHDAMRSDLLENFLEDKPREDLRGLFDVPIDDDATDEDVIETLFTYSRFGWLASVNICDRENWTETGYSSIGFGFTKYVYVDRVEALEAAIRKEVSEQVEKMRVKAGVAA